MGRYFDRLIIYKAEDLIKGGWWECVWRVTEKPLELELAVSNVHVSPSYVHHDYNITTAAQKRSKFYRYTS